MITLPEPMKLDFIDLASQRRRLGSRLEDAILKVVRSGKYILGPEVAELEAQLAAFCGAGHVISCANGTDALALGLRAWNLKPGDAVFVPAFTFAATAEVVLWFGATPVFVDVLPDTFNMAPSSLTQAIATAQRLRLVPKVVIAVDLFGQPADYDSLLPIAQAHGLGVMCDAAQSFGASYRSRPVGRIGALTTTSFFPAKPLGCYGDGGAVMTDDGALAAQLRSLRVHGQGHERNHSVQVGMNSRLDTLQAAILIEKLTIFPDEIVTRQRIAERYSAGLSDVAIVPRVVGGGSSVWAQYTLRTSRRDALAEHLGRLGIPTAIYYPVPLHRQAAFHQLPGVDGGLPVAETLAGQVISLPMHPYLDEPTQDRIIAAVREGLAA